MNQSIRIGLAALAVVLFALSPPLAAQESSDSAFTVHVVQRGENLFRIALKYGRLAEDIAEANGIANSDSIAVGQRLLIPLTAGLAQQRLTHVVASGETLATIAAAYGRSLADLVTLNRLSSADLIYVGQELTIIAGQDASAPGQSDGGQASAPTVSQPAPSPTAAPSLNIRHSFSRYGDPAGVFAHAVKAGETLSEIALRYNQTIDALAQANSLADPGMLRIGQRLAVPGVRLPQLTHELPQSVLAFTIDPLVFEAGRSGRIELFTSERATISGQFLGRELRVIARDDGKRHNILVGIPMFTEMSAYPLTLELRAASGQVSPISASVQVISGGYGRQSLKIADAELLAPAVEEEEIARIVGLAEGFRLERFWSDSLSLPSTAPDQRRLWHAAVI